MHAGHGRGKDSRKSFGEADYARLLDAAHQQLGGPIVVVWDNLNTHRSGAMAGLVFRMIAGLLGLGTAG